MKLVYFWFYVDVFCSENIYENACVVKLKFMYFSAIMGELLAVIINLNGQII